MSRKSNRLKCTSLAEYRRACNLSQRDAARLFGISQASWSLFESGRAHPRSKLAAKLRDKTGIPLETLLGIPS